MAKNEDKKEKKEKKELTADERMTKRLTERCKS
jgi:hypothetical protein